MQVQNAAEAGAQYAMVNGYNSTPASTAAIEGAVRAATHLSGLTPSAPRQFCACPSVGGSGITEVNPCGLSCSGGGTAAQYITVGAQASYAMVFTWPGVANPMILAASAVVRCC